MPEIPEAESWLVARFGTDVREVLAREGDAERDLMVLIGGWYQHVEKLRRDLPCRDDDRTVWGAFDVVATATLRRRLAAKLLERAEQAAGSVLEAIGDVDRSYMSFTEDDDRGLLRRLAEVPLDEEGWWWSRIPVAGPARRELDTFAT